VVLADDVIEAETPCLRQLLDVYDFFCAPVLAVMEVPPDMISSYGAIEAEPVHHNGSNDRVYRIRDLVEKPKAAEAPSNLAIIGRYVLTPEIFPLAAGHRAWRGRGIAAYGRHEAPATQPPDLCVSL